MTTLRASVVRILLCRRSVVALVAIGACLAISLVLKQDTSDAIAMISVGIAGANAAQGAVSARTQKPSVTQGE